MAYSSPFHTQGKTVTRMMLKTVGMGVIKLVGEILTNLMSLYVRVSEVNQVSWTFLGFCFEQRGVIH